MNSCVAQRWFFFCFFCRFLRCFSFPRTLLIRKPYKLRNIVRKDITWMCKQVVASSSLSLCMCLQVLCLVICAHVLTHTCTAIRIYSRHANKHTGHTGPKFLRNEADERWCVCVNKLVLGNIALVKQIKYKNNNRASAATIISHESEGQQQRINAAPTVADTAAAVAAAVAALSSMVSRDFH